MKKLEEQRFSQPNKLKLKKSELLENMAIPEISIEEEPYLQLLSVILKAYNPEWGGQDHPLDEETKQYFKEYPLSPEIKEFLDDIRALQRGGVDEEVLSNLALTYGHPERDNQVFNMINNYKPYVKNQWELRQRLFHTLKVFNQSFSSSPLGAKLAQALEVDKKARAEILDKYRSQITKLIKFFKPTSQTTSVKKVLLTPTDPLYKKDAGACFIFGDTIVVKTHINNEDNLEHEFTHTIINPIVEKLGQKLTVRQKEKIPYLASGNLKKSYGEDYFSLLAEEFIRTYNDVLKKGSNPKSNDYDHFIQAVSQITEDQFQASLVQEKNKTQFLELGITSAADLKSKAREYFDKFISNELRMIIYDFYQDYINRPYPESENFEQFVLGKFPAKLSVENED